MFLFIEMIARNNENCKKIKTGSFFNFWRDESQKYFPIIDISITL